MKESDFLSAFNQPWRVVRDAGEPFPNAKRPAAVLICLNPAGGELSVIFTQRASHLKHHAGQISFPGGKAETHDTDLIATAFRETEEEIGLATDAITVIGQLPPYRTISGFAVTPIVAKHEHGFDVQRDLVLDKNEVESVFEVPLSFLMDESNYFVQLVHRGQLSFPLNYVTYGDRVIWGATAGMMAQLRDHIMFYLRNN
ncbi:CoA pyrophosphatase [Ningiella sp. W23]|uniref:CoA pyrophosphatase n=1 Tax=Ningiella sp. W23 TaxID=3023715 RepID=UPI003757F47B